MLNSCEFIGYLGKDPEVKVAKTSGKPFTTFSIAVNKVGAGKDDKALWVNVMTFSKNGENAKEYLKKGSLVLVQGEIELSEFEGQDGKNRSSLNLLANKLVFLPSNHNGNGTAVPSGVATSTTKKDAVDQDIPF